MIIESIKQVINNALDKLNLPHVQFNVDISKFIKFGDFNSNVAMILAKHQDVTIKNSVNLAETIVNSINSDLFSNIEVVKPGFINFTLSTNVTNNLLNEIVKQKNNFPLFEPKNEIASVEFVSANPTGLLHIGHARNAALGESISRLLEKTGYKVIRDYVVNDAGNQMNILASSVLVRYWQLLGKKIELPEDSYHGEEIKTVAQILKDKYGNKYENVELNDEFLIVDDVIRNELRDFACNCMLDQIKEDLSKLNVKFDEYFSELTTHKNPERIDNIIKKLDDDVYKSDNALWFRSTKYGDDKDRVLIKSNGVMTYFLPDIYYHNYKLTRHDNITKAVIILGSDHYSYFDRVKAVLFALGHNDINKKYKVVFMQMVKLTKNGQEFKMSKRSGQSLTLMDLVNTIGSNAANWYLISASPDNHLEIDVDMTSKQDDKNSLFYIQNVYRRINNILNKSNIDYDNVEIVDLNLEIERNIINLLHFLKTTISYASNNYEPQKIVNYILSLTKLFNNYYEQVKIISDDELLTKQRLKLLYCIKVVLENTTKLINVNLLNN